MNTSKNQSILNDVSLIYQSAAMYNGSDCCMVPPSPELQARINAELEELRRAAGEPLGNLYLRAKRRIPIGMNDGLIYPGDMFPLGTPPRVVQRAAADRAPLRGTIRVIVVLVDFDDRQMQQTQQHFEDLFFSTGILPNGSVKDYFNEVTHGLVDIAGEVVGIYRLPRKLDEYAHGNSGMGLILPNARTMALDSVKAADPDVNFASYDNNNDGFVDAFVVVHAGQAAEQTGNAGDIWSHKWVLPGGSYAADGVNIYGYLTVPEGARIGVCCHELGHLLFGWPDLYDTDGSSEGVGNWCLMAGGSWNGNGETPAHPSAWCKADQKWVRVDNLHSNGDVDIPDVKTVHTIYRLWQNGAAGNEYFLVENRQKTSYDSELPGEGLLIWHIDEAIDTNSNEIHPKVALEQADGRDDLGRATNRGDGGDPFPGTTGNTAFTPTSKPGSKSYAGVDTCVHLTNISNPGPTMTAYVEVTCEVDSEKGLCQKFWDWMRSLFASK